MKNKFIIFLGNLYLIFFFSSVSANNIDPKDELQGVDGLNQILFVRLSMDGLEEMHTYSTDERMYENFEFEAFQSIEDTKQYILNQMHIL